MTRKTRSSIEEFGVRDLVDNLLEANATYEEIRKAVQDQAGHDVSVSALSRYRATWSSMRVRMQEAEKYVRVIAQTLTGRTDDQLGDASLHLLLSQGLKYLAGADEAFENADAVELGEMIVKAVKVQNEREKKMAESGVAKIDRPAFFLESMEFIVGFMKEKDPEGLKILARNFDDLMSAFKGKYAAAA